MLKKRQRSYGNGSLLKVVQFLRRPYVGNFSVERLYSDVRANLDGSISVSIRENKYFSNGLFKRLADAVAAIRCQADINHVTGDVHYLTFFLRRKSTILTILDCVGLVNSSGMKFWLLWFFWYWLPAKCCSQIIAISESTKKQLIRYINCDPNKIKVIYCNVSDNFQVHLKQFNDQNPRILHVGTGKNKNLERHIASLFEIPCTLVVIGELSATQLATLQSSNIKYESLSNLSLHEIVNEYKRCDMLLFASLYEGFGLPILEAQSIGRPVVTSNIWSMPEVAGGGAVLVDPYSIESIRLGIKKVISSSNYRENLIRLGLKNSKRFTAKAIGNEYTQLYKEFIMKD